MSCSSFLEAARSVRVLPYLKASSYKVGLLINLGAAKLQIKRLVN